MSARLLDLRRDDSPNLQAQAQAVADMLLPLTEEEREAVVRFVGEAVRLFRSKAPM